MTGVQTCALPILLTLATKGYPAAFAFTDPTHMVIGFDFGFEAHTWDITTSALGALVPNAPDLFTYDGKGNLLGTKTTFLADGGFNASLVSVSLDGGDAGATVLGPVPFSKPSDFPPSAVDYWPP